MNVLPLTLVLLSTAAQIGSPQSVRLVDDAPLRSETMVPMLSELVSSPQLQADLAALRRMRPGLGLPITLIIVGGATALACGLLELMLAGLGSIGGGTGLTPVAVAAVGASISLPLGTLGSWLLYNRLEERGRLDQETRALRALMR